ncbi:MAG: aldehyde ferredoxin oxidoreductase, partial [Chloroflexi bacterium]|nr:aldehyde ferredoxin oxidoreductase [Chloroflexota bacterium]
MSSEFSGQILHVNLSTGAVEIETPPESFYRTYLGGSAMGLYYILRDVPAGTDGLDPANVLTMMDSLLTGAPIAGQSRMTISARSPLTDGIGDSQGGGFFPAELRFAGFTGIVIKGRSPEPVYLWVHDGEAELRPAGHLWGKTTSQTTDQLKAELEDAKVEVAAIGPAGEKGARLAAIMSMGNRANGRTGMGAVMGSKNLKAVAVRGHKRKIPMA